MEDKDKYEYIKKIINLPDRKKLSSRTYKFI